MANVTIFFLVLAFIYSESENFFLLWQFSTEQGPFKFSSGQKENQEEWGACSTSFNYLFGFFWVQGRWKDKQFTLIKWITFII